jgi:hypothetical protein
MHRIHKVTFTERLLRERDRFETLVNRVGGARRMTMKGVRGSWSVKDVLAHILAHEQYIADRLDEIRHGEARTACRTQAALEAFLQQYGYPDFDSPLLDADAPDAWVIEKYRTIPLDEVVAHELQACSAVLAALRQIPEEALNHDQLFERVAAHTYKHYREHAADIRRWMRSLAVNARQS